MKKLLLIILLCGFYGFSQDIVIENQIVDREIKITFTEKSLNSKKASLFNVLGKVEISKTSTEQELILDVTSLNSGIYLLQIKEIGKPDYLCKIVLKGYNEEINSKNIEIDFEKQETLVYYQKNDFKKEDKVNNICQTTGLEYTETGVDMGLAYGFGSKSTIVHIGFFLIKDIKLSVGVGAGFSSNAPPSRGIALHDNYNWGYGELRDTAEGENYQFYFYLGKSIFKGVALRVRYGKGYYETMGYYQKYQQWHYKSLDVYGSNFIGTSVNIHIGKGFNTEIGYDDYNKLIVGLSYTL
jgi:hypothetical protein